MQFRAVAILAICATQCHPSFSIRNFDVWKFGTSQPIDRLINNMRSLYNMGSGRVRQLMYQRSQYETTIEFESGYIMGEIIERYRQTVLHVKNAIRFKNYHVQNKLIRLEFVQQLNFDIYHLVMMMHELPRKFGFKEEELVSGILGAKNTNSTLMDAIADLPVRAAEKEKQKKQLIRDLQEMQGKLDHHNGSPTPYVPKSRNRFWPIDYGWSIEDF